MLPTCPRDSQARPVGSRAAIGKANAAWPTAVEYAARPPAVASAPQTRRSMKYKCEICGHIYDPAEGDPDTGIPPGTPFDKIPDDWTCPDCGATKAEFVP